MTFLKIKKNKLKYVVITVILTLFIILMYCCYGKKTNEPFTTEDSNKIDVLLGKNKYNDKLRSTLAENTDDNYLNIVYSTYKTSDVLGNDDLFFLRYKPRYSDFKIIGDLVTTPQRYPKLIYYNNNKLQALNQYHR